MSAHFIQRRVCKKLCLVLKIKKYWLCSERLAKHSFVTMVVVFKTNRIFEGDHHKSRDRACGSKDGVERTVREIKVAN